jgi:hypothetical protein
VAKVCRVPLAFNRSTPLLCAALGWAIASGCSAILPAPCSPESCEGCCGPNGVCHTGSLTLLCGADGMRCLACSAAQTCTAGACVAVEVGGGSATGGGNATGGGTATGGRVNDGRWVVDRRWLQD